MKHIFRNIAIITMILAVLAIGVYAEENDFVLPTGETTVQDYAFANSSYRSVSLPSTVTRIGSGIFSGCANLETVTVAADNPVYYSEGNCIIEKATGKLVAGCGTSTVPSGVTAIGDYAFYGCTTLSDINIPNSVVYIGKYAFSKCTSLEYLALPDSVRYIDDCVFKECTSLKEVFLSKSLTYIPMGMCYGCTALERLEIPEGVTSVEGDIIGGCSSLQAVYIPKSVVNVSLTAFNTKRYTPFYYAGTFNEWADTIEIHLDSRYISSIQEKLICNYPYEEKISYTDDNSSLQLDIKIVDGEGIIVGSKYAIGDVVIPEKVNGYPITKVDIAAFALKKSLTSVTFPDSITELGWRCFYNCDNLKKIVFPKGITEIPCAFLQACDGITEIELPSGLTTIGNSAFSSCKNLERITIPEGVTHIGSSAFSGCQNLKEVVLPDSLTTFGDYVFQDTTSLCSIVLPKNTASIGRGMFSNSALESIEIPYGVTGVLRDAFARTRIKSIVIPSSVTAIGESAFYACESLESVVVEEGTQKIYNYVFSDCTSLKSVTLPSTLTQVSDFAFGNCPALADVCYTNTDKSPTNVKYGKEVTERFEKRPVTYTFNTNGGSAVDSVSGIGILNAPYSEKEGYVLYGWYLSPDLDCGKVTFPYYSAENVTLYAKWIPRDACIIMTIDQKEASRFGERVTNDVAPIIEGGRTMLPVRFVAESLGASIEWVGEARYIRITRDDGSIIDMRVDEKGAFANGNFCSLDIAPFIRNNRTYTPVRFVAESLGATVLWNAKTREAILVK